MTNPAFGGTGVPSGPVKVFILERLVTTQVDSPKPIWAKTVSFRDDDSYNCIYIHKIQFCVNTISMVTTGQVEGPGTSNSKE